MHEPEPALLRSRRVRFDHGVWLVLAWHAVSIFLLAAGWWNPFEVMVVVFVDACLVGVRMLARLVSIRMNMPESAKADNRYRNLVLEAFIAVPIVVFIMVLAPGRILWSALAPSGRVALEGLSAEAVLAFSEMFSSAAFWGVLGYMVVSQGFLLRRNLKAQPPRSATGVHMIVMAMIIAPMTVWFPLIPLGVQIDAGSQIDLAKHVAYPIGLYYVVKALIEACIYLDQSPRNRGPDD